MADKTAASNPATVPPDFSADATSSQSLERIATGTRLGAYEVLGVLGEGGFGTVYLASQSAPVSRRVALKVLHARWDARRVLARFDLERRTLAIMDHPHIAKVLDAGQVPSGEPFFAMELIRGVSITRYCDDNRLPVDQRLHLFVQVCHAIQHAHTKGIIHRDIKPANVLVTDVDGKPAPKVIDFGIAKALADPDGIDLTVVGQMIGTPCYMSPEQADESCLDVDARSDVYSLGVLLFELLTGGTPITRESAHSATPGDLRRMTRELEAPTPSSRVAAIPERVADVAARRATNPARLVKAVRGDLDWIVMRCLEIDRRRRYESPGALAADVNRHLADLPVEAGPPSGAYRAKKFLLRHKVGVTITAGLASGVLLGLTLALVGLREAQRGRAAALAAQLIAETERRRADAETERLHAVNDMLSDMFTKGNIAEGNDKAMTVSQMLTATVETLDSKPLAVAPLIESDLRELIGNAFAGSGDVRNAVPQLRKSLALRREFGSDDKLRLMLAMSDLALALVMPEQLEEAEHLLREAFAMYDPKAPERQRYDLLAANLGMVLNSEGKHAEAESFLLNAVTIGKTTPGKAPEELAAAYQNLGNCQAALKKSADAMASYQESLRLMQSSGLRTHQGFAAILLNLGALQAASGDLPAAETSMRDALARRREALPAGSIKIAEALQNLGRLLLDKGDFAEAESCLAEALPICRKEFPNGHPGRVMTGLYLARARLLLEHDRDAEEVLLATTDEIPPGSERPAALALNLAQTLYERMNAPEKLARFKARLEAAK